MNSECIQICKCYMLPNTRWTHVDLCEHFFLVFRLTIQRCEQNFKVLNLASLLPHIFGKNVTIYNLPHTKTKYFGFNHRQPLGFYINHEVQDVARYMASSTFKGSLFVCPVRPILTFYANPIIIFLKKIFV